MVRFKMNRSCAFVLTLCLFTVCLCLFTYQAPATAAGTSGGFVVGGDQPGGGAPPSSGDPDVPAGPGDGKVGKLGVARGGATQMAGQNVVRPVGEGTVQTSVLMERVRLFLLGIRSLFLHF